MNASRITNTLSPQPIWSLFIGVFFFAVMIGVLAPAAVSHADALPSSGMTKYLAISSVHDGGSGSTTLATPSPPPSQWYCGSGKKGEKQVYTAINIGCKGMGNPIMDMAFALIRFLSTGVGLIIVGSIIYGGIQYTASRGDPNGTAQAVERLRSNVIAMLLFLFAYAILNYVIPGKFLAN